MCGASVLKFDCVLLRPIIATEMEHISLILDSNLNTIKSFVQVMFDSLQKQISELNEENGELKRSLEFTQAELVSFKKEVKNLKDSPAEGSGIRSVEERIRHLEDHTRRKNLKILGLAESSSETSEQTRKAVDNLIEKKLLLPDVKVVSAHRVGKVEFGEKPRPIVAKFTSESPKISCLKSSNKLRGSRVFLCDDLSAASSQIRRDRMPELRQKRSEGLVAYFSGTRLISYKRNENPSNPQLNLSASRMTDGNNQQSAEATLNGDETETDSSQLTPVSGANTVAPRTSSQAAPVSGANSVALRTRRGTGRGR